MIVAPEPDEDEKTEEGKDEASSSWFSWDWAQQEDATDDEPEERPTHVAQRAPLELGLVDNDFAEIVSGLEEGDDVIVVGQSNLKDSAPVRLQTKPDGNEAAAAIDEPEGEG